MILEELNIFEKEYNNSGVLSPEIMGEFTDEDVFGAIKFKGFEAIYKLPFPYLKRIIFVILRYSNGKYTTEDIAVCGLRKVCETIAEEAAANKAAKAIEFTDEERITARWGRCPF